jgi:hypothetical protein
VGLEPFSLSWPAARQFHPLRSLAKIFSVIFLGYSRFDGLPGFIQNQNFENAELRHINPCLKYFWICRLIMRHSENFAVQKFKFSTIIFECHIKKFAMPICRFGKSPESEPSGTIVVSENVLSAITSKLSPLTNAKS